MLLIIMVVGCTTTILADISDMEKAYEFLLPLTLVTVTIYSNQDMMGNHAHLAVTSRASRCNHQAIALAIVKRESCNHSIVCLPMQQQDGFDMIANLMSPSDRHLKLTQHLRCAYFIYLASWIGSKVLTIILFVALPPVKIGQELTRVHLPCFNRMVVMGGKKNKQTKSSYNVLEMGQVFRWA